MELFRASTDVTVGDGEKCLFWHDRWRPGGPLRSQFSELYAIATRKMRTIKKELHQRNWIRALANITNGQHMTQFVQLWAMLQGVQLQGRPDSICWRWTASGVYSTTSAYRCQFFGSCAPFRSAEFWKGHAEAKCRFFT